MSSLAERAVRALDGAMEALWLVAIGFAPLLFDPAALNPFEPIKAGLIRRMGQLVLPLLLVRIALRRPAVCRPLVAAAIGVLGAAALATWLSPATDLGAVQLLGQSHTGQELSWAGTYARQQGLNTIVALTALFLAIALIATRPRIRRAINVAIASATLVALYAIAQAFGFVVAFADSGHTDAGLFVYDVHHPISTLGNPQFVGSYLVLVAPLIAWRLIGGRWAYALPLATCLYALGLTEARGPILALAAAALAMLAAAGKRAWIPGLLALVAGAALAVAVRPVTDQVRLEIWQSSAQAIAAEPFTGYGPDTQRYTLAPYRPDDMHLTEGIAVADRAHNAELDALLTAGWPGLAALGALAVAAVIALRRRPRLLVPLAGVLAAHAVDVQVGVNALTAQLQAWVTLGILAASSRRYRLEPHG